MRYAGRRKVPPHQRQPIAPHMNQYSSITATFIHAEFKSLTHCVPCTRDDAFHAEANPRNTRKLETQVMGLQSSEQEELRLLHKVCREGRLANIVKLTSNQKRMLNTRYPVTGRTALHEACANGHRDTVEQLLKLGVDVHKGTYLGGDTAIHLAVSSGERPLVFLLLRYGCDPNLPNNFGATCFHYAVTSPAIAKLLLRYGGNTSIRDRYGKTPWDYVHEGCPENREINKMMKQAYELEEHRRLEDELAAIKEEETTLTAKKREMMAIEESERTGHRSKAAMEYKAWREKRR